MEEAKDDLTATGREALDDLRSAALDPLADALIDPEDVPEVVAGLGEDHNFRVAATKLMEGTIAIYTSQAAEAVRVLSSIGVDAAKEGTKILTKMIEIGQMVASGRLSSESAQRALGHYAEALKLIGRKLQNKTKVEAYKRAQAALATAKGVLYSGLQVALQLGKDAALSYIGKFPTPPTA